MLESSVLPLPSLDPCILHYQRSARRIAMLALLASLGSGVDEVLLLVGCHFVLQFLDTTTISFPCQYYSSIDVVVSDAMPSSFAFGLPSSASAAIGFHPASRDGSHPCCFIVSTACTKDGTVTRPAAS